MNVVNSNGHHRKTRSLSSTSAASATIPPGAFKNHRAFFIVPTASKGRRALNVKLHPSQTEYNECQHHRRLRASLLYPFGAFALARCSHILAMMATQPTSTPSQSSTTRTPLPSRNPIPLSSSQEAAVRELYYKRVRSKCADEIRGLYHTHHQKKHPATN